jgi:hypothetical protein
MDSLSNLPMPPEELRALVGPVDPADYDNPHRYRVFRDLGFVLIWRTFASGIGPPAVDAERGKDYVAERW